MSAVPAWRGVKEEHAAQSGCGGVVPGVCEGEGGHGSGMRRGTGPRRLVGL